MPARKRTGTWILPAPKPDAPFPLYEHHGGYRFVVRREDGSEEKSATFSSKAKGVKARQEYQRTIDGVSDVSVCDALDGYEQYLREDGWGAKSVGDTRYRIEKMLPVTALLEEFTPKGCEALYSYLRWQLTKTGAPMKPDSHRNILAQVKMFLRWCVKKEYIKVDPFAAVEGIGRRTKGKPRMRIDEARKWERMAHHFATVKGEEGAVAALFALYLGLRASNIVRIQVRDIDDDATKLAIDDAKTEASERYRELPEELQPYLRQMRRGKADDALIWSAPHDGDWVTDWCVKICEAAMVRRTTAHGIRGLFARWAYEVGGEREARERTRVQAGHTSFEKQSAEVYVDAGAIGRAIQRRGMKVFKGGK